MALCHVIATVHQSTLTFDTAGRSADLPRCLCQPTTLVSQCPMAWEIPANDCKQWDDREWMDPFVLKTLCWLLQTSLKIFLFSSRHVSYSLLLTNVFFHAIIKNKQRNRPWAHQGAACFSLLGSEGEERSKVAFLRSMKEFLSMFYEQFGLLWYFWCSFLAINITLSVEEYIRFLQY